MRKVQSGTDFAGDRIIMPHVGATVLDFNGHNDPEVTRTFVITGITWTDRGAILDGPNGEFTVWHVNRTDEYVIIPA